MDNDFGLIHILSTLEDYYDIKAKYINGKIYLCFDADNPTISKSIFAMFAAWAEQTEKYRNREITKEQYDEWCYTYPELDTTQAWPEVPSQPLSDEMIESFENKLKNT